MEQIALALRDPSAVAQARRGASELALRLGFDAHGSANVALAVTECATNVIKHAGEGTMLFRPLVNSDVAGIEVLSIDKGPGMASVPQSMRDGYSTAGSPGLGLGALSRLTSNFEMFTQAGSGTVLRFEMWRNGVEGRRNGLDVGAVCLPKPGESVSGDDWTTHAERGRHLLVVADGLGHGPDAAAASRSACETAITHFAAAPVEQMGFMHAALRPTRGAAAAVVTLLPHRESGAMCGVGNISASTRIEGKSRSLVSHNGTLGHAMRKAQEFTFPFPHNGLLILHSDGVSTHWNLDKYPGLEGRHPATIAAVIYRDFVRGNDDATVVVVRARASA